MFYTYILENQNDRSLYIGYTANLRRRLQEHLSGCGGKTTSKKQGWKLIYYEAYCIQKDALGREKFLKSGSGRKYIIKQLFHYLNNHT